MNNYYFSDWLIEWAVVFKKPNVQEHSYNFTYMSNIRNYLIPWFKDKPLNSIQCIDIQIFFNKHNHLSESVLKKCYNILNDAFKKAILNGYCEKNPVIGIKIKSNAIKREKRFYNKQQSEFVIDYSKDKDLGLAIIILLSTGIRRSELVGLLWSDFNLEEKTVHVQRGIIATTGIIYETELKSKASNRIIPLSDDFSSCLKKSYKKNEYVLDTRSPYTYSNQHKKYMDICNANTGLDGLTPHEMRYTFGTVLREKGVDLYTIQKVMGHSDIKTTANLYIQNDINVLREKMLL